MRASIRRSLERLRSYEVRPPAWRFISGGALIAAVAVAGSLGVGQAPQTLLFPPTNSLAADPGALAVWQTAPNGQRLVRLPDLPFTARLCTSGGGARALRARAAPCPAQPPTITVDPARRFQRIAGFGGAFNERGWLALDSLSPDARRDVLRALFDPTTGAGYSLARTPIGASDYALNAYSLDEVPGDVTMRHFSIARDRRYLLPYIQAARRIAPDLQVWASPWSAPAWMKSNHSMVHGGQLLPRYEAAYARYLADYVRAYAASGVPIMALSVQNEPTRAPKYPSMLMPAAQMARFVAQDLGPLFQRLGLHTAIRVNEGPSPAHWRYSLQVLANPATRRYVSGSDIHGYYDSALDLSRLHRAYPSMDIWQTEDMNLDHAHFEYADATRWAAQIAEDLQNWASGWDFWNMVTDQTGLSSWGWHQDAVVIVDTQRHVVRYTPKFAAMAQFSRFIRPGAVRIATSGVPRGLVATAALDPDGRAVLVVVNQRATPATVGITTGDRRATATIPAGGIDTFVWR